MTKIARFDQLDLFDRRGVILPFPVARQRHAIRQLVRLMEQYSGGRRHACWRITKKAFEQRLLDAGVDVAVIASEVDSLRLAVRSERNRQLIFGRPVNEGERA